MVEGGGLENRCTKVPWVRILPPPPISVSVSEDRGQKPEDRVVSASHSDSMLSDFCPLYSATER